MSTAVLVITTPNGSASEALPKDPAYAAQVIAARRPSNREEVSA